MSYYRRGYSWEQIAYLNPPAGGWNPDSPPHQMGENQAVQLDNFLVRSGNISMRGGFDAVADLTGHTPAAVAGYLLSPGYLYMTSRVVSSVAITDPWFNVFRLVASAGGLSQASTTGLIVNLVSGAVTTNTWTRDNAPGPRSINFDGSYYNIPFDSSATILTWNGVVAARPTTLQYLSTGGATPAWTACTSAPKGAYDLKGYQSRIWLLGGADTPNGGTNFSPTTLYYSNPIAAGGGVAAADWKDAVTGTTNHITIDQNGLDYGVALAQVRNGLVILRRNSVYVLRGTTNSTYQVQQVSRETGCLDARSVVETDVGVYFIGPKGLMVTDGITTKNVSGAAQYTLQYAIATQQAQLAATNYGGQITCALTSGGQIMVSISIATGGNSPTGGLTTIWCAMFEPQGSTWVRITSQLWAGDATQQGTNYYPGMFLTNTSWRMIYAVGDRYVTKLDDVSTGFSFLHYGSNAGALYDKFPSGGTPYVSIPAVWKTHYTTVGNTTLSRKFGMAKRFFIDYLFAGSGLTPTLGWFVTPVDASDNSKPGGSYGFPLISNPTINGSVSTTELVALPQVQRQNVDIPFEVDDLGFDISWSDVARASRPTSCIADLYGIGVEYQPARDLR